MLSHPALHAFRLGLSPSLGPPPYKEMNTRVATSIIMGVLALTGSIGSVCAESQAHPAIARSSEGTSALADQNLQLSGRLGADLRLTIGVDVWSTNGRRVSR